MLHFGKVAREPDDSALRLAAFKPKSLSPTTEGYVRTVGRPRMEWTKEVFQHAERAAGGHKELERAVRFPAQWKQLVEAYCSE